MDRDATESGSEGESAKSFVLGGIQTQGRLDVVGWALGTVSEAERLGLPSPRLLYRWKSTQLEKSGLIAASLEVRVREFEVELQRVTRERGILKKRWSFLAAASDRRVGDRAERRPTDNGGVWCGQCESLSVLRLIVARAIGSRGA